MPSSASAFNRGKGKGYPSYPKRVYQTEQVAEEDEAEPELPDVDPEEFYEAEEPQEQDDPEQEEAEPQDDADEALHNLAQVLTVTSKKLQATVLGRKFTGRRSIEDRKRSSSCAACGAMGHWAGDSICPVSSKGGSSTSKGSGKNQQKGKDKSRFSGQSASCSTTTSYPKKAFVVNFGDEDQYEDPPGPETFHNVPTNLVEDDANPFVYITEVRPEVQMDQRAGGLGSILKLITAAIAVTGYHPDNGRDVQAVSYKPQEQGHCQEVQQLRQEQPGPPVHLSCQSITALSQSEGEGGYLGTGYTKEEFNDMMEGV